MATHGTAGRAVLIVLGLLPAGAGAQSVFTEVDVTVGHSTEDVQAAGTQVRVFGEAPKQWRFFAEASWADVWGQTSDAFGAAYPYNNRLRPMEVFAEKTNVLLHVEVHDAGIGIAADTRDQIFQPFAQGDGSMTRQFGGTGLGLSIASRLWRRWAGASGSRANRAWAPAFTSPQRSAWSHSMCTMPRRSATFTAAVRSLTPSLEKMFLR